jgi:mRNA interferase MazF
MIAPVTSNLKALRFAFAVQLEPSDENGLSETSVVMIFQMRAVDKSRILKKIGQLSDDKMKEVDAAIWAMLKPVDGESET